MGEVVAALGALAGAGLLAYYWREYQARQLARRRLEVDEPAREEKPEQRVELIEQPYPRRYPWIPWLAGLVVLAGLLLVRLNLLFSITFGVIVALLGARLEAWWTVRRRMRIEAQLADALDLMISTLRAGGGVLSALEVAARESRLPLREQLQDVLGRVRYGDDPQEVLRGLERRVPLETVRLFCAALSVHWEVGGSLAPILATVGRTIRDRIELTRRLRSLTTQSRVSTIAILLTTYFIALVVWRNDPQRMEAFLSTSIGQGLTALALLLQAVGIVWSSALSKLRY